VVVVCSRGLPSKEAERVRFGLIDVVLAAATSANEEAASYRRKIGLQD
jgi:hypothetical protein